jgi:branched-chain amino acid transport system permease protein
LHQRESLYSAAWRSRGSALRLGVPLGVVVLAALVPVFTQRPDVLNLMFLIMLYVTLGQSWNILAGFAGQINLGHAAFFGVGALVTRTIWEAGLPFAIALCGGGAAATMFAVIIGIPTFRLRGAYFSIGTLALAEALRITVGNLLPLITTLRVEHIVSYDLASRYYVALALAVTTTLSAYLLLRSRVSLGIRAVREDEDAARASGVNPLSHKLLALVLSSLFAGLAGGVFAYHQVSYYPSAPFSPTWTFDALLITFIGGLGTIVGPVVGAVFYGVVREVLATTLVQAHQVIFGVLFILVVLALPGGLVDIWSRIRRSS